MTVSLFADSAAITANLVVSTVSIAIPSVLNGIGVVGVGKNFFAYFTIGNRASSVKTGCFSYVAVFGVTELSNRRYLGRST